MTTDLITDLIPGPRGVTLGGRSFAAGEATLADLARLQEWVNGHHPDPLDAADPVLSDPASTPARRDRALYEAFDLGRPPAYSSPDGDALLGSDEGVLVFLSVALSRHNPGLTAADLADAAAAMTAPEFARVRRVFFGLDPIEAVARMLTDHLPHAARSGASVTWGEAVAELCREYGWTPATAYGLTLTEFRRYRAGGKPVTSCEFTGVKGREAETARLRDERYRRAYAEPVSPRGDTAP